MQDHLIPFLLDHNKKQSEWFSSPEQRLSRDLYRAEHPTEIAALKCMDGRIHLPVMCGLPPGIIQPFRNIGGKFDLGWPYFGQLLEDWVSAATRRGRRSMILATYHFSKGDDHRGCAGHNYDTAAARAGAIALKEQIERVFGNGHSVVHPIVTGLETDEDGMTLHGDDGSTLDLATLPVDVSPAQLRAKLAALYPDMHPTVVDDLLPLALGNVKHVAEVRTMRRPIADAEHKEQIIAVGRGFDWLHIPNKALIIGPYSFDVASPIAVAGKVALGNIKAGRVPAEEGIVLMSAALYSSEGPDLARAVEKARALAELSQATLAAAHPELAPYLQTLTGIVNQNTRLFTRIDG